MHNFQKSPLLQYVYHYMVNELLCSVLQKFASQNDGLEGAMTFFMDSRNLQPRHYIGMPIFFCDDPK